MKVLFFFPEADVPNKAGSYAHHNLRAPLIELGHEIIDFDFWGETKRLGRDGMHDKLRSILEKDRPDIFFHGIVEDEIDKEFADFIRDKTNTTSLVLFSDDDWRFNHSIQWVDHYNFALTQCHGAFQRFRDRGHDNVIMTQWGCNTGIYYPVETEKKYDVTFVGQPYLGRPELVRFLKQNGIDVRVWGAGWENFPNLRDVAHGVLPHFKMRENFSASRIVLGMAWCSADGKTPQIKGRLFEYAACKAFQLTNYDKRVTEYFKEGQEIVFYHDRPDLLKKIRYYLDHEDERNAIAGAACKRALDEHQWERRFERIFEEMAARMPAGKSEIRVRGEKPAETVEVKDRKTPKVSVVTYVYNFAEYLDEMIRSVLGQTYKDFEFLILDDGSTDNTREVVGKYLGDPRLTYVRQENIGGQLRFDELIGRVLAGATGEYVAFIGGDDVFMPEKLERQLAAFEADPSLDVVFSDLMFIDAQGRVGQGDFRCEESLTFTHHDLLRTLFRKNFIAHPAVMMKRKAIDDMGGFETGFAPDFHFWVKSAPYLNFRFMEDKLLKYRVHEKGASTSTAMRETCITESLKAAHGLRNLFTVLDFYPEIELCIDRPKALHDAYVEMSALFLANNLPVPGLAVLECQRALQHNPDSIRALNNMGVAYLFLGNLQKASETFSLLKKYPNINSSMATNIGTVEAVVAGTSKDSAGFGVVHEEMAGSELLRKIAALRDGSLSWERELGKKEPEKEGGDSLRSEIYSVVETLAGEGKFREAIHVLEKLVSLYPEDATLLSDMGVLQYQAGDREKAFEFVEKALAMDPGQRDARLNFAGLCLDADREDEAIAVYRALLDEDGNDVEVLALLGDISVRLGNREDALAFYDRILRIDPGNQAALSAMEGLEQAGLEGARP